MTVAALPSVVTYTGNGVTRVFAAPFRFKTSAHLVVTLIAGDLVDTLTLGSGYLVSGGGTDAGGTITLTIAPAPGVKVRIRRRTPKSQPMVYTTGDRFPAKSHEGALDSATLIQQEIGDDLNDLASRALSVPVGEVLPGLPGAVARAGRSLTFDAAGDLQLATAGQMAVALAPFLPIELRGVPGPAGNVAATVEQLQAAPVSNRSMLFANGLFTFEYGNFVGKADFVTVVPQDDTPLSLGAWVRQDLPVLRPSMFGATPGTIGPSQQIYFDRLNATIAFLGGAIVDLEGKTWIAGGQTIGGPQRRGAKSIIYANGVSLIVRNGKLKFVDGLWFGSFAADGSVHNPVLPFLDPAFAADIGFAIRADFCPLVIIEASVELDGNCAGQRVGGRWGDTGWQRVHYGFAAYNCDNVTLLATIHHFLTDGWVYSHTNAVVRRPFLSRAIVSFCGRNCGSLVGSNGARIDGRHTDPGNAPNAGVPGGAGRVTSNPASPLDVEGEDPNINTKVSGHYDQGLYGSTSIVIDSGTTRNVALSNITAIGTAYWTRLNVKWSHFEIRGKIGSMAAGQMIDNDNAAFSDGVITDETTGIVPVAAGTPIIDCEGAGARVSLTRVTIIATRTTINLRGSVQNATTIKYAADTATIADGTAVILMGGSTPTDVRIVDMVPTTGPSVPVNGYYVEQPENAYGSTEILSPDAGYKVKWGNTSPGAGGYPYAEQPDGIYNTVKVTRSKAYAPASIAPGGIATVDIIIPGLSPSHHVIASPSASLYPAVIEFAAYVDVNTARVTVRNPTAAAFTPPPVTLFATAHKVD